jgi:bacillopeptidase F
VKRASLTPTAPLISGQHYTAYVDGSAVTDFGGLTVPATDSGNWRASQTEQAETTRGAVYAWRTSTSSSSYGGSYTIEHLTGAQGTFRFAGKSVTWWTNNGPDYGVAYIYVDGVFKGSVNLYRSTVAYKVGYLISGLTNTTHTLLIRVHGTKSSASKGTKVAIDAFTVGSTRYSTPSVTYSWQSISTSSASGGKYVRADYAGASSTFTFRGTSISWYTILGSGMGKASVYVDGTLRGTYDLYSSTAHYGFRLTFGGLSDAVHTIKIVVLGTHRAASSGSYVPIDRWVTG